MCVCVCVCEEKQGGSKESHVGGEDIATCTCQLMESCVALSRQTCRSVLCSTQGRNTCLDICCSLVDQRLLYGYLFVSLFTVKEHWGFWRRGSWYWHDLWSQLEKKSLDNVQRFPLILVLFLVSKDGFQSSVVSMIPIIFPLFFLYCSDSQLKTFVFLFSFSPEATNSCFRD